MRQQSPAIIHFSEFGHAKFTVRLRKTIGTWAKIKYEMVMDFSNNRIKIKCFIWNSFELFASTMEASTYMLLDKNLSVYDITNVHL